MKHRQPPSLQAPPVPGRRNFIWTSLAAPLALIPTYSWDAGTRVVFPGHATSSDPRHMQIKEILETALDKTVSDFGPYELYPSRLGMNEARFLQELRAGKNINIAWSSTSREKEEIFLPIRIPLRKGLLGYRISLISKNSQKMLDQVSTLDELRNFSIGQGTGWGDTELYRANGFRVITSEYEHLFKMVAYGRFDLFPRGISEVFAELKAYGNITPGLAIERRLLIHYPWPDYFFFNKRDTLLKSRIETGLQRMLADGSFDAIFWKHNRNSIENANTRERRIIHLKNPYLPKETPLNNPALWFDSTSARK